ncbi:MAG: sulfatase [Verrucomicrobiota bacterium]
MSRLTRPALFLAAVLAARASSAPERPNVIFLLADDLGWADLGAYGSTFHRTPHLDRLAARGVRFTQAYAAAPLCSPTRASILTGQHPARIGITSPVCHLPQVQLEKRLAAGNPAQPVLLADSLTRLRPEYHTLAEALREAGYATAHFGKWHLGRNRPENPEDRYEPRDQGFDTDFPHTPAAAGPGGGYFAPWKFVREEVATGRPGEHIDARMADEAARFIAAHRERPFYLNFWFYSVHSPWNAREDDIREFAARADPAARQRNPLYAAMVRGLDDAVGRLLDAVDAAGVAGRTIIVFTSDNGGWAYRPRASDPPGHTDVPATSNHPWRSGKASLYEGGTREPLLVVWPGQVRPGTTSDALFHSTDHYPTLLAMCGLAPRAGLVLDGFSQVPALRGEGAVRDRVFCHFPHGSPAQAAEIPGFLPGTYVRRGEWKLIRFHAANADGTDRLELYHLGEDPGETDNRAAARPELARELDALIDGFLRETAAVVPVRNPHHRPGAVPAGGRKKKQPPP